MGLKFSNLIIKLALTQYDNLMNDSSQFTNKWNNLIFFRTLQK